jgi:hypothetical protein
VRNKLVYKPHTLCYFVVAAQMDEDTVKWLYNQAN